jgi:hypothetical protein
VLAAPWRMGTAAVGIMEVRLAFATRHYLAAFAGFESEHLSDLRSVAFRQPARQVAAAHAVAASKGSGAALSSGRRAQEGNDLATSIALTSIFGRSDWDGFWPRRPA